MHQDGLGLFDCDPKCDPMRPDELERRLQERLDALGPARRAELLHVLMLPDFDRADRIGSYWENPKMRTFGEGAPNQADLFRRNGRDG